MSSRTTSFSEDNELRRGPDWRQNVYQIIKHPKFELLFPYIKECLQLDNRAFQDYRKFRENLEAKTKLEPLHSSIWHNPPEDIWIHIVYLRCGNSFASLLPVILTRIQNAYFKSVRMLPPQHQLTQDWDMVLHSTTEPPLVFPCPNGPPTRQDSRLLNNPPDPVLNSTFPTKAASSPQKPASKQAPSGMIYQCPSFNCKKVYTKLAHFKRHLSRLHPDFGPRHPDHSPEQCLRRRASSVASNERFIFERNVPVQNDDEAIDDNVMGQSDLSWIPGATDIMHMGHGMSMNGMHIDPCNSYALDLGTGN